MQVLSSIPLRDSPEDIIRKIPIFSHLLFHLLPLLVQPFKLPLETLKQLLHLRPETDMILGWVFPLIGQFHTDIIDGYALFEADAFNLAEVEGPPVIVSDVVHQCLIDTHIGHLLEVDQQLVGHILQP